MAPFPDAADFSVAGLTLVVVLGSIAAMACLRKFRVGTGSATARFRMPWRFSLRAMGGLVLLVAGVLAVFRGMPCTAAVQAGLAVLLWTRFARFEEFRKSLADRSKKRLESALAHRQQVLDARKRKPR